MDSDEDESSIVELMDAVSLQSRDSEVLGLVFKSWLSIETLKVCRLVSKTFHEAATTCMKTRNKVRLDNVSSFQRYIQEGRNMLTAWENYRITINNIITADLLLQFCNLFGSVTKSLELDIKYREVNLTYLEDVFSEKLPNLEELTLKGKFPATAVFLHPQRMVDKMEKIKVFNLFAKGWHRLPALPSGEVTFKNPIIGQMLAAMPNLHRINYFPDVTSPREAHKHYSSFLFNLTENGNVILRKLVEIQHFTVSFVDIPSLEKFAAKEFPLQKLNVLVEEEVQSAILCMFLETFRATLAHLVIQSATENPIRWPRLVKLEVLTLIGVNVEGTDFLNSFPSLKTLHISQDRVTSVDMPMDRCLPIPHTLTCLKIIEAVAVNAGFRLSNNGLATIFKDLPYLIELSIVQHIDSQRPTFNDEGVTGSKLSISTAELLIRPRDLRLVNRNLMRFSHFVGSLADLRKLTLKASNITDVSLLCGIVNCQRLTYLHLSSPAISEKACIELMNYITIQKLRIQDFGEFTSSGKSEILMRMRFQEVFYA